MIRGAGWIGASLAAVGSPVVDAARWLVGVSALAAAIALAAPRATTWRRTVRAVFLRDLRAALLDALPAATVLSILVGLGLVQQALYWLDSAGQVGLVGDVMVVVLVRELGPMLVALVLAGRSGTALLVDLAQQRAGGQLRMLDALGVDPFLLHVVPRSLALTLASFTLTILFVAATLLVGFVGAALFGVVTITFAGFVDTTVARMSAGDFLLLPAKSLALGFAIGAVCCHTALAHRRDPTRIVASGFARAVLAAAAVSGLLSLAIPR
jgi:phospholipid/cholesterol/gamma-HCH transport system permease protein